jgi:DNA-binding NarL/FixJ family response regulator
VTSVVIVDDQELVRSGLRLLLEGRGVAVVGEAADGLAALDVVARVRPDVVLMDIRMPGLDGIEATRRLMTSTAPPRVLILTTYDMDEDVYGALHAGAAGFLLKTTPPDRLVDGIHTVAAGEALLDASLTRRLIEDHVLRPPPTSGVPSVLAELTSRELEVLVLIARGRSNSDIASELFVSEATVKTHVNHILSKLGLTGRVQAVVLAYECGLVRAGRTR